MSTYSKSKAFAGIGTKLARGASGTLAPPPAPTLSTVVAGSLTARTLYVRTSLENATGETLASNQSTIDVPANSVLKVTSPAAVGNATNWYVYISDDPATAELQEDTGAIAIGTDFTEGATGFAVTGAIALPTSNTSGTFVDLAERLSIDQSGSTSDLKETTNMDSVGGFKEWLPTVRDAGELDFEANLVSADASQQQLLDDFNKATQAVWQITWPAGSITGSGNTNPAIFSAYAYVTSYDVSYPTEDIVKIKGKLKITGQPTLTQES